MVKLVPAKCPSCGANIQVDDNLKKTECEYCKTMIIVDDAIEKYQIEISGKVEVDGIKSNNKKLEDAKKHIRLEEYKEAYKLLDEILKDDSFNIEAQCLHIKCILLFYKLEKNCLEENFLREDNKSMWTEIENAIKAFERLKKFDEKEEYTKYLNNEISIIEYLEKEYNNLVNDEQICEDYSKKISSKIRYSNFQNAFIIISDTYSLSRNTISWTKNLKPPYSSLANEFTFSYIKLYRNGRVDFVYKDDYKNYHFEKLYPNDGKKDVQKVTELSEECIRLLDDTKYNKELSRKLTRYPHWSYYDSNKKSFFEKLFKK